MRICLNRSVFFVLCSLFLSCYSMSLFADNYNQMKWFIDIIKANDGKSFCIPSDTSMGVVSNVILKFAKSHPEFHDQITDQQTVQGLAENYPCIVKATPELLNTDVSKLTGKNIEVAPTGEYASIDTKPTIAIMQKLHDTLGHENDSLIDQITKRPENYMPPTFFALADLLYRQGDTDKAIFWFNAARIRGFFDAAICTDVSAKSAISLLNQQMPRELIKKQFDDIPKLKGIIDRVLKWDEVTPYNYDHLWISLHGIRAMNSGLGIANQIDSLTVPRETWDSLAQKNRDLFRSGFDESMDIVQKQRAVK